MRYKHPQELSEGIEVVYILDQREQAHLEVQFQNRTPPTTLVKVQLSQGQDLGPLPIFQTD